MRRLGTSGAVALVACALGVAVAGAGTPTFAPRSTVVNRFHLAGVKPTSSPAQIRRAWGRHPSELGVSSYGFGRTQHLWGTHGGLAPATATINYLGRAGASPLRFAISLQLAEVRDGISVRTQRGDRYGTVERVFRRRWPGARRIRRGGGSTYYAVPSAYRGWQLVFVFSEGVLAEAELARSAFVQACYVRTCRMGYP